MTVELQNKSDLEGFLFWGPAKEQDLGVVLVVKATYDISDGVIEPVQDSPWPVHLEPLDTPYGQFPANMAHRKPRLDLILLGNVYFVDRFPEAGEEVQIPLFLRSEYEIGHSPDLRRDYQLELLPTDDGRYLAVYRRLDLDENPAASP